MKKKLFVLLLSVVCLVSLASVSAFAATASSIDDYPDLPSDMYSHYVLTFDSSSGHFCLYSSDTSISVLKGASHNSIVLGSNSLKADYYATSSSWSENHYSNASNTLAFETYDQYYSSQDVLSSDGSVFFSVLPCPAPSVVRVIRKQLPNQLYPTFSGNLAILLPVGLAILAALLAISLIPRVLSFFR